MSGPSKASALLWLDGKITLVGDDAAVERRARSAGVPIQDLDGRLVLPGFVDAHMHFLHAVVKQGRPQLAGARSPAEALQRVRTWLAAHPGAGPVVAEGWDESDWATGGPFTRAELDKVTARPLVLRRICGHVAVANGAALERIAPHWSDERVDRQSGLLLEEPSLFLNRVLPEPPDRLAAAVEAACALARSVGVTALGDYSQPPFRKAFLDAAAQGRLGVRVASSVYADDLAAESAAGFRTGRPAPGPTGPSPWLRDGGVKLFLDGSIGGHTAHLAQPYADRPGHVGRPTYTDNEVTRLVQAADAAGVQVHAHAIGDAAIAQGLTAFEGLATKRPWRNVLRHRLEHFELADDALVERAAALGIVASCQPNFVGDWSAAGGLYEQRLGARHAVGNRFATFLKHQLPVAFGSDGMPFGPLHGLARALAHPVQDERLDVEDALRAYTATAAWSLHWEDRIGSLAPGNHADLLVLGIADPTRTSPDTWVIEETIVDGVTRHRGHEPKPHA